MPAPVRLAVVMDPIAQIKPAKDSTLAMLLSAQARGYELYYLEQRHLWLADGRAYGRLHPLTVRDDREHWFRLGEGRAAALEELDVLLMRKDPPFDTEYVYTTYILDRAQAAGCLVVNAPQGLRDMNEKVYTAWFADCCAPTLITRDMADMERFLAEHGKAVLKPLHGMGGRSIFVVEHGDKNLRVVFETLTDYGRRFAIVQKYLSDIVIGGDSRVLLVDGEPVPYALARIPKAGETRGNLAAGARGVVRELSPRDREIAQAVGPVLARDGMMLVGLDVIGDYLTEINVTSPTGMREIMDQSGFDVAGMMIDAVERRAKTD